ncbi:MAG: hypothetical protein KJO07_04095 [Deltaproteobacteria bacterium]|nr:hypothetical protein [Deltaproteobacteria bacterium]
MRVALVMVLAMVGCKSKGEEAVDPGPEPVARTESGASEPGKAASTDPYRTPVVSATDRGLQIEVERVPGTTVSRLPVPYTAEPYVLWAQPKTRQVSESDLLGTKLAIDLNGDGDTVDLLAIDCQDGKVVIADAELHPVTDRSGGSMRYLVDGKSRITRLGKEGAHAMVYSPCKDGMASVGLATAERGFEVLSVPGPVLQIMIFEPHDGPTMPAALPMVVKIDGQVVSPPTHVSLNSEPIFGEDVMWTAMYWAMVPISADNPKQVVTVELRKPKGRRTVASRVNVSEVEGVRRPLSPGVLQLGR